LCAVRGASESGNVNKAERQRPQHQPQTTKDGYLPVIKMHRQLELEQWSI
jgi:hypothetical protein